jgi:actin-related protein
MTATPGSWVTMPDQRGMLNIERAIEKGLVVSWEVMERLMYQSFYMELKQCPEDHPIFFTEPLFTPLRQREKMYQLLFETFD